MKKREGGIGWEGTEGGRERGIEMHPLVTTTAKVVHLNNKGYQTCGIYCSIM